MEVDPLGYLLGEDCGEGRRLARLLVVGGTKGKVQCEIWEWR